MKLKSLAFGILSASTLAMTSAHAVQVNGGTVHFEGEVVNAACAIDAGSINQTVPLGQVKSSTLAATGDTSTPVGFNIQLNDCAVTTQLTAAVRFSGVQLNDGTTTYPEVLALQSSAAGAATNVGVQILDSTGKPLTLNGTDFSTPKQLINGTNILSFQARYYAVGQSTAGTANADATFQVEYL
ncbi:fimbrial protein [Escherichia coli]|uniref:type 1 fimbrial major subunit FimA n=1 Tax=Escherichia coli TaxID=562 RepID=UPI002271A5BC|nr:type 1 fimbrial major subunit FimA [Escherichia coli]MCX9364115.1 fimbrial protein [Escherichia coli]HBN2018082.1 type 1 fimbrial major subunit FimA [Escherichia coli]